MVISMLQLHWAASAASCESTPIVRLLSWCPATDWSAYALPLENRPCLRRLILSTIYHGAYRGYPCSVIFQTSIRSTDLTVAEPSLPTLYTAHVNAEIIAIGSELLTPFRQDTNSLFLTDRLNQLGIEVHFKDV